MTVDITQEEMNILNLNKISAQDVQYNVEYMRAAGYDDDSIRKYYSNVIEKFKPVTKTAVTDTKNIEEWNKKGGITPYEFAVRTAKNFFGTGIKAGEKIKEYVDDWNPKEKTPVSDKDFEWTGEYNNVIDTNEDKYNKAKSDYENRVKEQIQKRQDRDKRVNEGTASFFDRAGAWIDRNTNNPYPAETYEEFLKRFEKENLPPVDYTVPASARPDYNPPKKDLSKKIGVAETLADSFATLGWLPHVGGFIEGADDKKQRDIQNKIIKGQPIRQDELDFLNNKIEEIKEKNVRGYTIGGAIVDNVLNSLIRFGGEMALGGAVTKGLGLATEIPKGASLSQKASAGLENAIKFGIVNTLLPSTYNDTYQNYQERRLNDSFRLTEDGKVYFREAEEKPATSFMKSMLSTFFMFSTEAMGEVMGIGVKGGTNFVSNTIGKPLFDALKKNKNLTKFAQRVMPELSKKYEQLNNLPIKGKSLDWLKSKVKYDGFLEEIGEEVLEDLLNVTFQIDKERSLENYAKALFKSPDEWAVLCGAVAIQGGTLSIASHLLGNYMIENGASEEETVQTLEKLGEEGVAEKLSKLAEEGEVNVDDYNSFEKRKERLTKTIAENLKNIHKDKDYSDNAAELLARVAEHFAETKPEDFELESILDKNVFGGVRQYDENGNEIQDDKEGDVSLINDRINEIYAEVDSLSDTDKEYAEKLMAEADLLAKVVNNDSLSGEEKEAAENIISGLKNVVYNQSAQYAGADENNYEEAAREWDEKGTDSRFFKKWFGNSKVVDENGKPLVVYHGSVNTFEIFDRDKASPESDMGAGFYFTDNEWDADDNYYNGGADFDNKIARLAEQIQQEKEDNGEDIDYEQAKEIADKQLRGEPHQFAVYLNMNNPCYVGENETILLQDVFDNIDINEEDYEDYNEYEQARQEAEEEAIQTISYEIDDKLGDLLQYKDIERVKGILFEYIYEGGVSLQQLKDRLNEEYFDSYETGDIVSNEVARRIVEALGYDGIIDSSVTDKFSNMNMEYGTTHYIAFSPEQIKSVDNRGTFDSNNPNIYFQDDVNELTEDDKNAIQDFKDFVEKVLKDKTHKNLSKQEKSSPIVFGKTPKVLVNAGISDNNIAIGYGVIDKAQSNTNPDHNLSKPVIKKVLEALHNPIAIVKDELKSNEKTNNRYGIIIDLKNDKGNYILVSIDTNKNIGSKNIINDIRSIHSRESFVPMIEKALDSNRLIKIKKSKLKDLLLGNQSDSISEGGQASLIDRIEQKNKEVNNKILFQSGYHGSPFEVDSISTDYVGTGEGAAAHGWGAYIAKNIETGWEYRNRLNRNKDNDEAKVNGKPLSKIYEEIEYQAARIRDNKEAQKLYNKMAFIEELMLNRSPEETIDTFKDDEYMADALKWFKKEIVPNLKYSGTLLKVDIPKNDVLLDEDKQLKEQSEKIKDALEEIAKADEDGQIIDYSLLTEENSEDEEGNPVTHLWLSGITDENLTGKEIYSMISLAMRETYGIDRTESDKLTSQLLDKYGIKGIKYNGQQDGRCYVIFDDKAIKVLKKYYQFAGEKSKVADKKSLKTAIKMIIDGYDAEKVRKETGWFKGVDGKWRYEISDNDAKINEDFYNRAMAQEKNMAEYDENNLKVREKISKAREKRDSLNDRLSELYAIIDEKGQGKEVAEASKEIAKLNKEYTEVENEIDTLQKQLQDLKDDINSKVKGLWNMTLGDLLDHEKLYAAYPSIKNVRIEFRDFGNSVQGSYSELENQINLSNKLSMEEVKRVLMHEIQHYIQDIEGFAQGSSTNSVERQLRKSLQKIIESDENVKYEELMDELEIVNKARTVHSIYQKPENITKTYWYAKNGKGWYAPKKTSKIARKQYINGCCQAFLSENIEKYKDELTKTYPQESKLDRYNSYLQKSKAELDKIAKSLDGKAKRMLAKVDLYNENKIKNALKTFEEKGETSYGLVELYHKVAGEVEARNTSQRMHMTEAERMNLSPSDTADVEDWEQLVIFDDGSLAFAESDMSGSESDSNPYFDKLKSDNFIDTLEKRDKRGAYIPAEKIIELYKNSDESTFLHEMAHWYLDLLTKYAEGSEELTDELNEVRKWLKNDGGEFTVEQHEKFARGFEAYIRSGYAKNNKLKKVFEYFKNFLLDIYQSLKDLRIAEEEMPQIISLFDRLLSTEKERIQSTVFDKISEIDSQIEKIKENEQNEFAYLDSLWEESQQKTVENDKVREYLALADKMTARETKEVKDFKKRYKNATLEILEAATGKPRTWIANPKNWEKLQELIGNVDDKITTSVGMQDSWKEFYLDEGVSYENDEIDGDYNLAEQAFEVLAEGNYNRVFEEDYRYEDINKFLAKFDYLAAKVKTEKYANKQAALTALETFYNNSYNMPSMPDEILKSVGERILKVQEDTFDDMKENYNKKSSLSGIMQLQLYITKKLDDLKIYNPETRYRMRLNRSHKLYKYIKNVRTVNAAKKEIRRINNYVIDDMQNGQRNLLNKEIQKQIRINSKLVKVGNMKKGKFDYRTNTVFAELVNLNKLSRKEAEVQLGALLDIQNAAKGEDRDSFDENPTAEFNKANDFQTNLKNEFLQYRSMRLQDLDVTHTIKLLNDILELKEKGRKAKSEEDFINKTQKWNTKNNLIDLLEVTKLSGIGRFGANWIAGVGKLGWASEGVLANWESINNALFDKETAEKYSLLLDEANSEVYARNHILDFYNRANKIYGFRKPNGWDKFLDYDYMQPLIKLMQEYNKETRTFRQRVFSINNPNGYAESNIELSKAQAITMYAWGLNEKLEQRLMTQFGLEQIRDIFENWLSEQDRQLAWALVDTCESMREDINEVFINTTGLSLPKVENYFPSKAERVQSDIDLYHDFFVKSSSPSFIKDRKVCNRIPMKPMSPLEILIPHINKTAKYVVMSEKVNFLNQVFKDTAIKTKMQEIWGSENGAKIYQVMINKLAACTYTNYSKGSNLIKDWANELGKNYVVANIGGNTKVMFGQLLSMINYAENMPSGKWTAGFVKAWAKPKETFNYMMENCPYLQSRLAGNTQNEVISILTSEKDRFRTLKNFMTANTKWGDIIAIIFGGKPYVDHLIEEKGMPKEEAFNKFVEDTLRAQQAGTTSAISEWQSEMARNTWTKLFFAFRNTSIQYERKFVDTLIQAKRGDISKAQAIKKIMIYKVLNPILFTSVLGNLSLVAFLRALFDGDDDAIMNLIKDFAEAIGLSGNNGYGMAFVVFNAVEESLLAHFDSDYKDFDSSTPIVSDVQKEVRKIIKGDLSLAEYIESIASISGDFMGVPASRLINAAEGAVDTVQGNVGIGLSRMSGWGKYTSTKAWTGEAPSKKKRSSRSRHRKTNRERR